MANDTVLLHQDRIPEKDFLSCSHNIADDTPLHWHNYIEIEIVLSGTAEHIHNGVTSTIKRGSVSIFRINDYHEIKDSQKLEVLKFCIKDNVIPGKTLTSLNSIENNLSFNLDEETLETVVFFFNACKKENNLIDRNEDYIKNILECIIILLLRLEPSEIKPTKKHQNNHLHMAIEYLHSHFRENPSLSTISELVHYSPTHFSHVFHKKIGKSYNDYLNELKVTYAKQLLTTTNLKVIDVGYQSGFNSYNNFYSTFKQHTNLSPAEYKKKKFTNTQPFGYSWRFAIIDTDINTDPAYVYIKTCLLMHESEYYFSYYYSYDYAIIPDSIENVETGEKIDFFNLKTTDMKSKKRTQKVEFYFKSSSKAPYCITLKMGKGLNNVDCNFRYTSLSNLTLKEISNKKNKNNLAQDFTHAAGNVTWSPNSDAYYEHIDR